MAADASRRDLDHAVRRNPQKRSQERPMRRLSMIVCAALLLPLAACQGADKPGSPSSPAQSVTIQGDASYLEKIVLPPGSMLHVQLVDTRHADTARAVIAEDKFPATTVPIPFRLEVEGKKIAPNVQYGLRASVRDVDEKLVFTTDTAVPVDLKSSAPVEIRMVRAGGSRE
ncbi:YbaY family lipoprotein [Nannocystis pusilla]|uniref:YbaY family lipoprotein n=1 Tax=Nannocystis pusilla TaxID=889268 RepID=A0ABS7U0M7_9BACT|nr:YbaY family lipoprotein [Nannocystis pusilla]